MNEPVSDRQSQSVHPIVQVASLLRPTHWLKNVFVIIPVPFALGGDGVFELSVFCVGLLAMCIANSSVYVFNDWVDVERDRDHPVKRFRPLASKQLPENPALALSAILAIVAMILAVASEREMVVSLIGCYLGLQLFYCVRGKEVPLVDVFLLSSGFVIRVLLGCALVSAPPSNWLLLCSSALALFLALAKRRADIVGGLSARHRPSLIGYSRIFLDQALSVSAGMTVIAYALYCMDGQGLVDGREFWSVPFVVFGVMEYLRLVYKTDSGDSPVDVLLSSPSLIVCGAGWLLAASLSGRLSGLF
ncbi:MAG: UbiA prenyltransferase family protein [Acidobacteriota bacterium]|nr:UbiA prenyltransferase family protein [Acidobacteriota bacterium]